MATDCRKSAPCVRSELAATLRKLATVPTDRRPLKTRLTFHGAGNFPKLTAFCLATSHMDLHKVRTLPARSRNLFEELAKVLLGEIGGDKPLLRLPPTERLWILTWTRPHKLTTHASFAGLCLSFLVIV